MSILEKLKQEAAVVRTFIKENLDEAMIEEIYDHKEEALPFLLKAKTLPEALQKRFNSPEDAWFLFEACKNESFTPSASFLQSLKNQGDEKFLEVLKSYPSFPWDFSFGMLLLNEGFINSFLHLFETRPEFQKIELASRLLKEGISNEVAIAIALESEDFVSSVIDEINKEEGLRGFSRAFINKLVLTKDLKGLEFRGAMMLGLSKEAMEKILKTVPKRKTNNYAYASQDKILIPYFPELEYVEPKSLFTHEVIVENAPEGSYFRLRWLQHDIDNASSEEIIDLFNRVSSVKENSVLKVVSKNPISFLENLNFEVLENSVGPTALAKEVAEDTSKALYLLDKLSSKYSTALRKVIPIDLIPAEKNQRKKSYFNEIFKAIKDSNVDEFRLALSHGYNLATFRMDCFQSSKKRSCELVTLRPEFVSELNLEELLLLVRTPFNFQTWGEDFKIPKTTLEEAEDLFASGKIGVDLVFDSVGDKVGFIKSKALDEDAVSSLFSHRKEEIMGSPELFKAYIFRAKNTENMSFDSETVRALAEVLEAKELRSFLYIEDYQKREIVDLKAKDGQRVFTKEEILVLLKDRYCVESDGFLIALIKRDRAMALDVVNAYLGGNKAMSALVGSPVKITRQKIKDFEKYLEELTKSTEEVVESVFASGGRLKDFQDNILDWEQALLDYGNGREVVVESLEINDIEYKLKINTVVWRFKNVSTSYRWERTDEDYSVYSSKCKIESLTLGHMDFNEFDRKADDIKKFLDAYGITAPIEVKCGNQVKVKMLSMGINFQGREEFLQEVARGEIEFDSLKIEDIDYLSNYHGLFMTEKVVEEILKAHINNPEAVDYLAKRLGNLDGYVLNLDDIDTDNEEYKSLVDKLKNSGVKLLPESDYDLYMITQEIQNQGINFEPVELDKLNSKQKLYLIKFLEEKIDPRFKTLNLSSLNLDTFESLGNYDAIKSVYSMDDAHLVQGFLIPSSVASNKKIMKALRELIAITGAGLSFKVQALRNTVEKINPKIELTFSDFVDYSNHTLLEEAEGFEVMSSEILKTIDNHYDVVQSKVQILQGKQKAEVLRFLRSASQREDNYVRDTLEMVRSVINGVEAYKENLKTLRENNGTEAQIKELEESISSVTERLLEVVEMDDVEHMHDRLVPLCSFIKNDPVQPLGQDKFRGLERSKEAEKDLGFRLFFPRTRGDLTYLGDKNGWCVNHHSSYGDNVIKNGNILVGICEPGTISARENVIALAHYIHKGQGEYNLEQLRRPQNQDASKEFDSRAILRYIKNYLASLKDQEK